MATTANSTQDKVRADVLRLVGAEAGAPSVTSMQSLLHSFERSPLGGLKALEQILTEGASLSARERFASTLPQEFQKFLSMTRVARALRG